MLHGTVAVFACRLMQSRYHGLLHGTVAVFACRLLQSRYHGLLHGTVAVFACRLLQSIKVPWAVARYCGCNQIYRLTNGKTLDYW